MKKPIKTISLTTAALATTILAGTNLTDQVKADASSKDNVAKIAENQTVNKKLQDNSSNGQDTDNNAGDADKKSVNNDEDTDNSLDDEDADSYEGNTYDTSDDNDDIDDEEDNVDEPSDEEDDNNDEDNADEDEDDDNDDDDSLDEDETDEDESDISDEELEKKREEEEAKAKARKAINDQILAKYDKIINDAKNSKDWKDGIPSDKEQENIEKNNAAKIKIKDSQNGPFPLVNNTVEVNGKSYSYVANKGSSSILGFTDWDDVQVGHNLVYGDPNDYKKSYTRWLNSNRNIIINKHSEWKEPYYDNGDETVINKNGNNTTITVTPSNNTDDSDSDSTEVDININEYAVVTPEGNIIHKVEFKNIGDDPNSIASHGYFVLLDTSLNGEDGTPIYSTDGESMFITNGDMVYAIRPLSDTKLYATDFSQARKDLESYTEDDVPVDEADQSTHVVSSGIEDTAIRIITPNITLKKGDTTSLWYMEVAYPTKSSNDKKTDKDINDIGKESSDKLDSSIKTTEDNPRSQEVTRTIYVTLPDGSKKEIVQRESLTRVETKNLSTNKIVKATPWSSNSFKSYSPEQIEGYETLVDGQPSKLVAGAPIEIQGKDVDASPKNGKDVYVSYSLIKKSNDNDIKGSTNESPVSPTNEPSVVDTSSDSTNSEVVSTNTLDNSQSVNDDSQPVKNETSEQNQSLNDTETPESSADDTKEANDDTDSFTSSDDENENIDDEKTPLSKVGIKGRLSKRTVKANKLASKSNISKTAGVQQTNLKFRENTIKTTNITVPKKQLLLPETGEKSNLKNGMIALGMVSLTLGLLGLIGPSKRKKLSAIK